ncbi:hypothetical protein K1T73_09245 [Roseovarius sp. SCSIO 43702]|uniref:COG3650 family protein n=1 Tax=Roseovarius sp. SCSIO 43702 TaxID=2823043 RepID=UPI001C73346E|nr:hypothetical protein [Roseovarius sp. SCSIO 43702]QYX55304.1 hypothetical protein K1T73_09245 [Roseovarius sp. SCSIO 43702]
MRALIPALCVLTPTLALAEPSYHRVTGVAAGDTLNVRSAPDATSVDLGDIAHDAHGIELTGTDATGEWGRILWQDGNGWISMRFLEPYLQPTLGDSGLPEGLDCGGTEPFWSLTLGTATAHFSDPGGTELDLDMAGTQVAEGRLAWPAYVALTAPDSSADVIVEARLCSDGMSDRDYPWQVELLLTRSGETQFLSGCCNLPLP